MAGDQEFVWTQDVLRTMLEYVDGHLHHNGNRDYPGLEQHLKSYLTTGNVVPPGKNEIKKKLLEISNTASTTGDKHKELWRRGVKVLNFKHDLLKGIFSAQDIKEFKKTPRPVAQNEPTVTLIKGCSSKKRKRTSKLPSQEDDTLAELPSLMPATITKNTDLSSDPLSTPPDTDDESIAELVIARYTPVAQATKPKKRKLASTEGEEIDEQNLTIEVARSTGIILHGGNTTPRNQGSSEGRESKDTQIETSEKSTGLLLSLSHGGPSARATGAEYSHTTLSELDLRIEQAVSRQLELVNLDQLEPVIVRDSKWTADFVELMQTVFGNKQQLKQMVSLLMLRAHDQPLSLILFVRCLVAASILKWGMLPDPTGIEWDVDGRGDTSSNKTLDTLLLVLTEHGKPEATKPQRSKIRHMVLSKMAEELLGEPVIEDSNDEDEVLEQGRNIKQAQDDGQLIERTRALMQSTIEKNEILERATLLGQKLYLALAPLFVPDKADPVHMPKNSDQYMPLIEDEYHKRGSRSRPFPPVRGFSITSSDQAIGSHDPRIPRFQQDLTNIFKIALTYRVELIKRDDALYEFDFPHYGMQYNQHVHADAVLAAAGRANRPLSNDDRRERKIYVTTMFGVRARVRKAYVDEDYGEERIYTRAVVHVFSPDETKLAA